jgi:hypothetical protein
MGLLDFLRAPGGIEGRLIAEIQATMQHLGFPQAEAKETARAMVQRARRDVEGEGTINLPTDLGDQMLGTKRSDPQTRQFLEIRRAEGANDADIRWWWNLPDLERRTLIHMDEWMRTGFILTRLGNGDTMAQAVAALKKAMPTYAKAEEIRAEDGPDRPLPIEVKNRVNMWTLSMSSDPGGYSALIERASSFNALVREFLLTN